MIYSKFFGGVNISQVKLKVLERSTGNKKVEEWTFLPKNWNYSLEDRGPRPVLFEKNFAILKFHIWGDLGTDTGDIMILNLVTRRSFWIRHATLVTQMKEKAAGRIAFGGLLESWTEARELIVENDRLVIFYVIEMSNETRNVQLG